MVQQPSRFLTLHHALNEHFFFKRRIGQASFCQDGVLTEQGVKLACHESFEGGEGDNKIDTQMEITAQEPEKAPEKDLKDMNPSQLNNIVDKLNVSVGPAKDDDELFGKIDIGEYDDDSN